jgi:hypothetical protein
MLVRCVILGIGIVFSLGCVPHTEEPTASAPAAAPSSPAASTPAPAASAPAPTIPAVTDSAAPSAATPAAPAAAAPEAPAAAAPATEQVQAKAGVGLKGQSLKEESGVMVEAAKAYFRVEQKVVLEFEIPKNLQLFEATEGRAPKSHEEFMEKIIRQYNVKLPTLPAGHEYIYDPERKELMVKRPARN